MSSSDLPTDQYINHHNLELYLTDAISQMLLCKQSDIKIEPRKFLREYFESVREGTHTLFREYSFINACHRNRISFIANVWSTYRHLGTQGDLLSLQEYYSLITLLCNDFDYKILQKSVKIILMEDAIDCVMSYSDFIYAFQLHFIYNEFCYTCEEIFNELKLSTSSCVTGGTEVLASDDVIQKADSVTTNRLIHAIKQNIYGNKGCEFRSPPQNIVISLLSRVTSITFYGFLMGLCKNERFCEHIDVLPSRPTSSLNNY